MLSSLPYPIKKTIYDSLFKTPILYKIKPIANTLGLQTLRTLFLNLNLLRFFNGSKNPELADQLAMLEKDGYLIIPNFLDEEVAAKVKEEYYNTELTQFGDNRPKRAKQLVLNSNDFSHPPEFAKNTAEAFYDDPRLTYLVSRAGKTPLKTHPGMIFYKDWYEKEDIGQLNNSDATNNLHADVSYPSFKAWYYIEDMEESQGAMLFCKGSHKMTPKRLAFDHEMSIIRSKSKPTFRQMEADEVVRDRLPMNEVPMVGKANTLVLFNVQGFHKRGQFTSTKPRYSVLLDFRVQKSLINYLFLSKKLKNYFVGNARK